MSCCIYKCLFVNKNKTRAVVLFLLSFRGDIWRVKLLLFCLFCVDGSPPVVLDAKLKVDFICRPVSFDLTPSALIRLTYSQRARNSSRCENERRHSKTIALTNSYSKAMRPFCR